MPKCIITFFFHTYNVAQNVLGMTVSLYINSAATDVLHAAKYCTKVAQSIK